MGFKFFAKKEVTPEGAQDEESEEYRPEPSEEDPDLKKNPKFKRANLEEMKV